MTRLTALLALPLLALGCSDATAPESTASLDAVQDAWDTPAADQTATVSSTDTPLCNGDRISPEAAEEMLVLTQVTEDEDIYSIYDRVDGIATGFEACGDPWGMFPTTYRRITARGVRAVEEGEFEDADWAQRIIVDFASRYLDNLGAALTGDEPSWAWAHYYDLADRDDVSRTRAVVVGMTAHLTLDLPYSLVAIGTEESNKDDFFVFGEMMIEVSGLLIEDLRVHYDTDAEDLLTGFFVGDWVDDAYGSDTTITLSYQTIRTKSWNNRWWLEQGWSWLAETEIWSAFWAVDGVLATLDASETI